MSPYHRQHFNAFVQQLQAKHPEAPGGFQGTYLAALEQEYMRGVNGENSRIKAIDDVIRDRHVASDTLHLVNLMKWDGKSTAGDVAEALGPVWAHGEPDAHAVTKAAESVWDRVPAIRAEFPSRQAYVALKCAEAEGRFKIHAPGKVVSAKATAGDVAEALGPVRAHGEPDAHAVTKAAESVWDRVPAIRAEFPSREAYVAFKCAETEGRFKIHAPRKVVSAKASDFKRGNE